jgi:hypothetical protein
MKASCRGNHPSDCRAGAEGASKVNDCKVVGDAKVLFWSIGVLVAMI